MKPLEIKIARKYIISKGYNIKRMDRMNREAIYWTSVADTASFKLGRETCRTIANVYLKRYEYYLNK